MCQGFEPVESWGRGSVSAWGCTVYVPGLMVASAALADLLVYIWRTLVGPLGTLMSPWLAGSCRGLDSVPITVLHCTSAGTLCYMLEGVGCRHG